jgi:hypothetical protein
MQTRNFTYSFIVALAAFIFCSNTANAALPSPTTCSLFSCFSPNRTVLLMEGEPIYLELTSDADINNLEIGTPLNFRVLSNVLVDGREVIRAFTPAIGTVTRIESPTTNTVGKVQITVRHIRAVDGQQVLVNGPTNLMTLTLGVQTTVYVQNEIGIQVR